jgi:hypothetical protein
MRSSTSILLAVAAVIVVAARPLAAAPLPMATGVTAANVILVAEGCGPGRWRGPWGGCRGPGWGPGPYAYSPPSAYYGGNGCPPGFWHGPWGHCRDTPYHGRLPGGGWK